MGTLRAARALAALAVLPALLVVTGGAPATAATAAQKCTIVGTPGPDRLVGTSGDDVICGLGGDDRIKGLGGDDVLRGGAGDDVLRGGPGDDLASGGAGDDVVHGQGGDDRLRGGTGDDVVVGGRGDDVLGGSRGADILQAEDRGVGDDVRCGPGPDQVVSDLGDSVRADCESVASNDPPSYIALFPAIVAENDFAGTEIGDLRTSDPEGNAVTFSLVAGEGDDDNDRVALDEDVVEADAVFDHETDPELSIRVRATDSRGAFIERVLSIEVTDNNDAPVAGDDEAYAFENSYADISTGDYYDGLLTNDTDPDAGDTLRVTAISNVVGGQAVLFPDEIVRFSPTPDTCGEGIGSFDYTVSDGHGGTDIGTVRVDVGCDTNNPPTAVDDTATVVEDTDLYLTPEDNDTDPDGDDLYVDDTTDVVGGTVQVSEGGSWLFRPTKDLCGPAAGSFDYVVADGRGGTDTGTVVIDITCVNDAPVALDDEAAVTSYIGSAIPTASLLANDGDPDAGDTLSFGTVLNAVNGSVTIVMGDVYFTPDSQGCATGTGGFDYTVADGSGTSDLGHVEVTISCGGGGD